MRQVLMLGVGLVFLIAARAQTNNYTVTNIVTSAQDPRLINPWGLSRPSKSSFTENQWWASDQVSGLSTLYDVDGTIANLAVKIPPASGTGAGSPTGTAFDPWNNNFVFATLDGTVSIWVAGQKPSQPGKACLECHVNSSQIVINHASSGASYQGVTIAKNATTGNPAFYVANANGGVEVYDGTSFAPLSLPAGAFTDSTIPASYTPAGIQAIGTTIFATYNASAGGGVGFVDAYDTNGKLLLRLQSQVNGKYVLDQPWGVALAPADFGAFSNTILIGNTGNGLIGAYRPSNGQFLGFLKENGQVISIPGLWGLEFGDGNTESGPVNVLYFNAGGASQTTGVFGAITPD